MTQDDIRHLGTLARIALSDAEVATFNQEIDAILSYVSTVKNIAADAPLEKALGARFNVLRPDAVTIASGTYTEAMLTAMPHKNGQYLSVKKILKLAE